VISQFWFCNFLLISNFFKTLSNFRDFGLVLQKRKVKKVNIAVT
jgi:hypothetical protein